jgi:hypothetical protein
MRDASDNKTPDLPEIGEPPRRRGRPAKHGSAAERQRAYRERMKAEGKRVVSRVVADVRDQSRPLQSDIIDLSEVKR